MDICTLIIITTTTLQMCWSDNICRASPDGTKQLCSGAQPIACGGVRYPTYDCKRPDGSTYVFEDRDLSGSSMSISPKKD